MTILLLGEPGAGKSSLVHTLCTDGPQISRDPRGETCEFAAFSSHRTGCFIDSPGVGSHRVSLTSYVAELEAILSGGSSFGPVHAIAVLCPCTSVRISSGLQVLQALLSQGLQLAMTQVLLVGTKSDKADQEEVCYFRNELAPVFFGHAHGRVVTVSCKPGADCQQLEEAMLDLPSHPVCYEAPEDRLMIRILAPLLGYDETAFSRVETKLMKERQKFRSTAKSVQVEAYHQLKSETRVLGAGQTSTSLEKASAVDVRSEEAASMLQGVDGIDGIDGIVALKNLAPTPSAICTMGILMCIAASARDFSLHTGDKSGSMLRQPGSFRASLLQAGHAAHAAFVAAQSNARQLKILMGAIPHSLQMAVNQLVHASSRERSQSNDIDEHLECIRKLSEKCVKLAEDTHSQFHAVLNLLWEIEELLAVKRGCTEQELAKVAMTKQQQEQREVLLKERKQQLVEEFQRLSEKAEMANQDFQKVLKETPRTGDLLGPAFADLGCTALRALGSVTMAVVAGPETLLIGALSSFATSMLGSNQDDVETAPPTAVSEDIDLVAASLVEQLSVCARSLEESLELSESVSTSASSAMDTLQKKLLEVRLQAEQQSRKSQFSVDVVRIATSLEQHLIHGRCAMQEGNSDGRKSVMEQIKLLEPDLTDLQVKAASLRHVSRSPSTFAPIKLSRAASTQSSSTGGAVQSIMDAWHFKLNTSSSLLLQAEERRCAELDDIQQLNAQLLEESLKLRRSQLKAHSLEGMLETVRAAILRLCNCKEAWVQLLEFFLHISEVTKFCCQQQVPYFKELSSAIASDIAASHPFTETLKDQVHGAVLRTSHFASTAAQLAQVYHELSSKHFLAPLRCLGRIFTLTGAENVQLEMERLMEQCRMASVAIDDKVKEQKEMHENLRRIREIPKKLEVPQSVRKVAPALPGDIQSSGGWSATQLQLNEDDLI